MAKPAKVLRQYSVEEYLAIEERSDTRHEYLDGFLHALAGETERHNLVVQNIAFFLRPAALARGCRVVIESVKLHVPRLTRIYYPDVMVLCDRDDDHPSIKRHPCFVAEVLSASTEATDRREKLDAYRSIAGLLTYLIVDPERPYLEVHQRMDDQWRSFVLESGDAEVPCLATTLPVAMIYEGLTAPRP